MDSHLAISNHVIPKLCHFFFELGALLGLGDIGTADEGILLGSLTGSLLLLLDFDALEFDGLLLVLGVPEGGLVLLDGLLVEGKVYATVLTPLFLAWHNQYYYKFQPTSKASSSVNLRDY